MSEINNVVLVHGGFVDGSGWQRVHDLLTADGLSVTVVQNPTLSLEDDVAVTRRVIDAQDGPVVLVGHSYGGAVITEAGTDDNVAALVYISAFAPDAGESVNTLLAGFPQDASQPPILPPNDGFLFLDRDKFGGFNRSSQHLDLEVCAWDGQEGGLRLRREGHRCGRRAARRWPGGRTGSGFGRRSVVGCRVRTRRWRPACRSRLGPGGSVRLAGCRRSLRPRCRGASCRSPSGRRSRSCTPGVAVSARSQGRCRRAARRRQSRGSCAATPRPGAGRWSTGPRRPSGTRTGGPGGRRSRSSPRMRRCGPMCRTGLPARSPGQMVKLWRARRDRKSTRLNSSHVRISYAVF